jgi:FlaA1/EpsC-like NDP-sugar epimerase
MLPSQNGRLARRVKNIALRTRSRHLFIYDQIGTSIAGVLAMLIALDRLDGDPLLVDYLWVIGIVVASRVVVDIRLGLYRHSWRFASVRDMARIVFCTALGSALGILIVLLIMLLAPGTDGPPRSFWLLEGTMSFAVLASARFAIRAASELASGGMHKPGRATRALLYGAGWAGVTMARSSQRNREAGIVAVGFLDDDPDLWGRRELGLPIYGGLDRIETAVRDSGANALFITMPTAPGPVVRRIVERAMELKLEVRTVPAVTDLMDGSLDASRLRSVRVEDLLRRPAKDGHASPVRDVFSGKTVVITGAAGSIGSELARQTLILDPARIVLVDRAESALYLIQRELETRLRQARDGDAGWGNTQVIVHLANVASRNGMRRLFEHERPDVVLHAAAFKHVPMLEDNPSEAVQVNIGGTLSIIDAAMAIDRCRLVLVSTDKAVWPSSVMGASKRVAEMLVTEAAARSGLTFASVRFGNVLGSNGSVLPIFQDQLEKGEPLTVTDPEMTRYFMSIPEAAWLILDAAALASPGDLFALDMGQPVRIIDLARDLIRLSGRDPDSVPIKITGLRKGEKLHEELFYDQEQVEPTESAKVLRTRAAAAPDGIREAVARLIALADGDHDATVSEALHQYVRESVSLEEEMWRRRRIAIEVAADGAPTARASRLPVHTANPARRAVEASSSGPSAHRAP